MIFFLNYVLLSSILFGTEMPFHSGSKIIFADTSQAMEILKAEDDFIQAMGPFDRSVRMKCSENVTSQRFLAFLSDQALAWDKDEVEMLSERLLSIHEKLSKFQCPFPEEILLVKTTGKEEGGTAYTRQNAIIIPKTMLDKETIQWDRLLIHEFFHLISRADSQLQDSLYSIIGFERCQRIPYPESLISRKLTNPDAPFNDHFITLNYQNRFSQFTPLLISSKSKYINGVDELFEYLDLKMLALKNHDNQIFPMIQAGRPLLIDVIDVISLFDKIGANTSYIIHPDEIMADNFMLMVLDQDAATPWILDEMRNIFTKP